MASSSTSSSSTAAVSTADKHGVMDVDTNGGSAIGGECTIFLRKRQECYDKHYAGREGGGATTDTTTNDYLLRPPTSMQHKKCWSASLHAKRCLAFVQCPQEAAEYYITPTDTNRSATTTATTRTTTTTTTTGTPPQIQKGICAAYDEAYCKLCVPC